MPAVTDFLGERGLSHEVISHEPTTSSVEEAHALGVPAAEVVKAVMFKRTAGYALAVVPAARRLDMRQVRKALDDNHARLATEDELERDFPDYELGALPPLGSLLEVPVFADPEVMEQETVEFAAGKRTESVKMSSRELFESESATVVPLAQQPPEGEKDFIG